MERESLQVIAIGLNTIRELCSRQPLAMDQTLLRDLVQYKKHKDKGVVMAARGLLSLFRAVAPDLLDKKDRGRPSATSPAGGGGGRREYGQVRVSDGVEGLELLDEDSVTDSDDGSEEECGSEDDGEKEESSGRRRVRFASLPPRGGGDDSGTAAAAGVKEKEKEEFEVGNRVGARWKGSRVLHPGVVAAKNDDGSFRVEFDDGDVEERESAADMQPEADDSEGDSSEDEDDGESGSGENDEDGESESMSGDEGGEDASDDDGSEEQEEDGKHDGAEATAAMEAGPAAASEPGSESSVRRRDAEGFLSAEEFDKIRRMRHRRELEAEMGGRRRGKRPTPAEGGVSSSGGGSGGVGGRVDPEDLLGQHKRRRMEKAERLESVLRGREGREGAWKDRHERKRQAGGLRNDQAAKNKPYLMVRGSRRVRAKLKVSVADRNRRTSRAVQRKQFRGKNGGK